MEKNMKTKQFNIYTKFVAAPIADDEKGYVEIEGWASKAFENGKPIIDRDLEHVLTSSLDLTNCKILLAQHNWDRPVGKIELSHRPEGIWLKGTVYKEMDEKVYFGVKNGILDSFSIGFSAKNYEYIKVDGEDILQLKDGAVHEVSIVTIPSNVTATIESVKSLIKDGECIGLQCSVEALKKANPTQDCSCNTKEEGNVEKKKDIKQVIKALTFEETENSNWNQLQKLDYYFEILEDTIEDNFYETMWYEGITPEEAKANILGAIQAFVAKLDEFKLLDSGASGEPVPTEDSEDEVITKQKRDEAMHIKSNEGADVVTADATGDKILEGEELEVNPEQEVVNVPEQTSDNNDSTEPSEVAEKVVEEIVTEEVPTEEVPEKLNVEYLSTVDLNGLSAEEVEELYNEASQLVDNLMSDDKVILLASASDILDRIEALVAEDIQ